MKVLTPTQKKPASIESQETFAVGSFLFDANLSYQKEHSHGVSQAFQAFVIY